MIWRIRDSIANKDLLRRVTELYFVGDTVSERYQDIMKVLDKNYTDNDVNEIRKIIDTLKKLEDDSHKTISSDRVQVEFYENVDNIFKRCDYARLRRLLENDLPSAVSKRIVRYAFLRYTADNETSFRRLFIASAFKANDLVSVFYREFPYLFADENDPKINAIKGILVTPNTDFKDAEQAQEKRAAAAMFFIGVTHWPSVFDYFIGLLKDPKYDEYSGLKEVIFIFLYSEESKTKINPTLKLNQQQIETLLDTICTLVSSTSYNPEGLRHFSSDIRKSVLAFFHGAIHWDKIFDFFVHILSSSNFEHIVQLKRQILRYLLDDSYTELRIIRELPKDKITVLLETCGKIFQNYHAESPDTVYAAIYFIDGCKNPLALDWLNQHFGNEMWLTSIPEVAIEDGFARLPLFIEGSDLRSVVSNVLAKTIHVIEANLMVDDKEEDADEDEDVGENDNEDEIEYEGLRGDIHRAVNSAFENVREVELALSYITAIQKVDELLISNQIDAFRSFCDGIEKREPCINILRHLAISDLPNRTEAFNLLFCQIDIDEEEAARIFKDVFPLCYSKEHDSNVSLIRQVLLLPDAAFDDYFDIEPHRAAAFIFLADCLHWASVFDFVIEIFVGKQYDHLTNLHVVVLTKLLGEPGEPGLHVSANLSRQQVGAFLNAICNKLADMHFCKENQKNYAAFVFEAIEECNLPSALEWLQAHSKNTAWLDELFVIHKKNGKQLKQKMSKAIKSAINRIESVNVDDDSYYDEEQDEQKYRRKREEMIQKVETTLSANDLNAYDALVQNVDLQHLFYSDLPNKEHAIIALVTKTNFYDADLSEMKGYPNLFCDEHDPNLQLALKIMLLPDSAFMNREINTVRQKLMIENSVVAARCRDVFVMFFHKIMHWNNVFRFFIDILRDKKFDNYLGLKPSIFFYLFNKSYLSGRINGNPIQNFSKSQIEELLETICGLLKTYSDKNTDIMRYALNTLEDIDHSFAKDWMLAHHENHHWLNQFPDIQIDNETPKSLRDRINGAVATSLKKIDNALRNSE